VPVESLDDDTKRSPSSPLSFCSMTCVTVSSSVLADAPGYVALIPIVGGAIAGYCEIGRRQHRQPPRQHHDDREHPREDRPIDEEPDMRPYFFVSLGFASAGFASGAASGLAGTATTSAPGRIFCRPSTIT
jgi:hypothetical protein